MRALVVFHGAGNHWLSRWLRVGFKHVFCVVDDVDHWVRIDAQRGTPVVEVVAPSVFEARAFYERQGFTVVEVEQGAPLRAPFVQVSCTGLVKAMLNIHAPFAVTPYQLYRHLQRSA